jgi:ABC-type Fe3+ transport system permease subunit
VTLSPVERRERRRRRRQAELRRWGIAVAAALIVFGLGVALGQALHDNPKPGGTVTLERTLSLPSAPPGSTVTP